MANVCTTTYKCFGDRKEINSLFCNLEDMRKRKEPKIKNGYGNMWLGELVTELGYSWREHDCRGEIFDYSKCGDNELDIMQETAWCEQRGVRECIEKCYPSIKVYYQDEEPGCENFTTNDDCGVFAEKYYFDTEGTGVEYFEDIEEAAEYISKIVGKQLKTEEDIQAAIDEWQKAHPDSWMCFYEFQYSE